MFPKLMEEENSRTALAEYARESQKVQKFPQYVAAVLGKRFHTSFYNKLKNGELNMFRQFSSLLRSLTNIISSTIITDK